jgi:hypothetical protein
MGSIGSIGDMGFIPDIGSIGFIVDCLLSCGLSRAELCQHRPVRVFGMRDFLGFAELQDKAAAEISSHELIAKLGSILINRPPRRHDQAGYRVKNHTSTKRWGDVVPP